jgi:hypothetical protein
MTPREAKEFLVAQIVAEASHHGTPLDDIEQRMLYFTETDWMPEDTWQAAEAFDARYDAPAYEARIKTLIQSLLRRRPELRSEWNNAVATLQAEDHYLLVMTGTVRRRPLVLYVTGVVLAAIVIAYAHHVLR